MGHDAFRAGVEAEDLGAMVDALSRLKLAFPTVDRAALKEMKSIRQTLLNEAHLKTRKQRP